jgi:3',5'-cyclic AMP phosphodiesterase CpdA
MKIVHISDIHCSITSEFLPDTLSTAIEEINKMRPNLVIVTGDLTLEGFPHEFNMAKNYLSKIKAEKLIGVGNHDYRSTGYLIANKMFPRPTMIKKDKVVVFYLSTARPDRDIGEVGYRQAQSLEKELIKKYKNKFKIVTLHHHLVPVPDTGLEENVISDAGDVLKSLTNAKVNLILAGHRHRPWKYNLNGMEIIHAGSISCLRLRGFFKNSYNIINIRGKRVKAKLKIVGGEELDFEEVLKRD